MTTPETLPSTIPQKNGFGLMIAPESIEAAKEVAKMLSQSELVPKQFSGKPNDILIAGAMGHRLGLDLFSALAGIAVVNGRPTLWGDAQLAVCQARPDFGGMLVTEAGDGETFAVEVAITRKGHGSPYVGKFSVPDAKKAGLWGKQGPWTQYPKRMVLLRARALALRSAFADALAGFHAREEIEDEIDVTSTTTVHNEPKAAKRRKTEPQPGEEQTPDAQPAETTEPPVVDAKVVKDVSVDACVAAYSKLWNGNEAARASAKELRTRWNLKQIADLASASDTDRAAFIGQVNDELAKAGV